MEFNYTVSDEQAEAITKVSGEDPTKFLTEMVDHALASYVRIAAAAKLEEVVAKVRVVCADDSVKLGEVLTLLTVSV